MDDFKVPVSPGRGRKSPRRSPIKPGEEDAPMLDLRAEKSPVPKSPRNRISRSPASPAPMTIRTRSQARRVRELETT